MLSFLDTKDLVSSVEGKTYEKNQVVKFTIKEVVEQTKIGVLSVRCEDHEQSQYTFKLGSGSPAKKKLLYAFLMAFYSREDIIANNMNPVDLVGQVFEIKSDGQAEWEGKNFQRWNANVKKVETLASAEEFTS